MSILNHLQFQPIEDDFSDPVPQEHQHDCDDDIELHDDVDEAKLNNYWDEVVDDIHSDPKWFSFAGDEPDEERK